MHLGLELAIAAVDEHRRQLLAEAEHGRRVAGLRKEPALLPRPRAVAWALDAVGWPINRRVGAGRTAATLGGAAPRAAVACEAR